MEKLREEMQKPEVQQQVQQFSSMMSNPDTVRRLQALTEDPELKEMFDDVKANGPQAMMKYYNDPKWLAIIGRKMGNVGGAAPQGPPAPSGPRPEPTSLIEAAR